MPPKKRWQWLKDLATAPKSGQPLPKASWEKKTHNTRFKPVVTSSSATSSRFSSRNQNEAINPYSLTDSVLPTTQAEEDELQKRRNPWYFPKRLKTDTHKAWGQLLLHNKEMQQRLISTPEGREQKRAWDAFNAQHASPVNLLPVPNNYFKQ